MSVVVFFHCCLKIEQLPVFFDLRLGMKLDFRSRTVGALLLGRESEDIWNIWLHTYVSYLATRTLVAFQPFCIQVLAFTRCVWMCLAQDFRDLSRRTSD